jgi:uncharacterized membrane protein YeiH
MFSVSDSVFNWYDLGATLLWGISGAMLGARKGYDIMGIFIVAMVSATGGGLLRDGIFLPDGPPRLIKTPNMVAIATALVFFFGQRLRKLGWMPGFLTLADAVGIGAYAVVGMNLAMAAQLPLLGIILVGVVNAVGGSILRDVLMGIQPEVLRPGVLLGLASLMGSILFVGLLKLGVPSQWAGAATVAFVFAIRVLALRFGFQTRALSAFEEDWRRDSK